MTRSLLSRRALLAAGLAASSDVVLGKDVAFWEGRAYYGRVCSNSNCRMCNSIQAQLSQPEPQQRIVDLEVVDEWVPMPMDAVHAMLRLAPPKPGEMVCDPGCGDARILTTAVSEYGCLGFGTEINAETYLLAKVKVNSLGLSKRIEITRGDARAYNHRAASIVFMYLYTPLINRLIWDRRFAADAVLVSYNHWFDGATEVKEDGYTFFVK